MAKRFKDNNATLQQFSQSGIWVVCPKCSDKAKVVFPLEIANAPDNVFRFPTRVVCQTCGFAKDYSKDISGWLGPKQAVASAKCMHCLPSRRIVRKTLKLEVGSSVPVGAVSLTCPNCGNNLRDVWRIHRRQDATIRDPYFGLPVLLQVGCCGETLFAYNLEHLQYLKSYIEADLRERKPKRGYLMVSRLPQWIKAAKNRDAVLHGIERLEAVFLGKK